MMCAWVRLSVSLRVLLNAEFRKLVSNLKLSSQGKYVTYETFQAAFGDAVDGVKAHGENTMDTVMQSEDEIRFEKSKQPSSHHIGKLLPAKVAHVRLCEEMRNHFRNVHEAYLSMSTDRSNKFLRVVDFRDHIRDRLNVELSNREFTKLLEMERLQEKGTDFIRFEAFRRAFGTYIDGAKCTDMWSLGGLRHGDSDPMLREAMKVAKSETRRSNRTRVPYDDGSGNPPTVSPRYVKRKGSSAGLALSPLLIRGSTKPLSRRNSSSSRLSS